MRDEALIREARRLRRRRWAIGSAIVVAFLVIAGLVITSLGSGRTVSRRATGSGTDAPRLGALTTLHLAGALATSHAGELYVADTPSEQAHARMDADRVLARMPDGRFRVVASNLPYISGLAVAPDGALYVADAGWVREIGRNGSVRTIAGDGHAPRFNSRTGPRPIAAGTPATRAPLGSIQSIEFSYHSDPLQIAFDRRGQLYISNGDQVLRMTARGSLEPISARIAPVPGVPTGQLNETGNIAIAPNGTIYTSSGMRGWSVWAIHTNGKARYLTYARQSGGDIVEVQSGPHGAVYAANASSIVLLNHGGPRPAFVFRRDVAGQFFWLTNFAITPSGVIYADELGGGGGFEAHQQLVSVTKEHVSLLWQEKNRAPR